MLKTRMLLLAASVVICAPGRAQDAASAAPSATSGQPGQAVEGATADRVAQVERCSGRKFESLVEIDPIKHRSTRVKLCANPGSTDAEWAKTLESAIAQIEQRNLPAEAKDKLIAELEAERAKFAPSPKLILPAPAASFSLGGDSGSRDALIAPAERYETSKVPPLPSPKAVTKAAAAAASRPVRPMAIRLKCLTRGETGAGSTCDFFDRDTVLALSAVQGLENGGLLQFRRKGEVRGEVLLAALPAGQSIRVKLPSELCRGISYSKVEIELMSPQSNGMVAARMGPYGLRC